MSLSLYPIIKELGNGGFGKTYLATNTLLPARPYCVIKQLKPVIGNDPVLQQLIQDRFEKEATILEGLGDGSNGMIPRLYAYFVEQGEFYLSQEYIDGQTLNDRVRTQGLFTEQQVRDLLKNILPTLTYVHSRGIVHRDIKPDNIMLRQRDNQPILIDFGAVKETMSTMMRNSGNSTRSIVIGTPGFMPMEQMSGRPMYPSDIYSLGLTAIYVLTGKMPEEIESDPSTGDINWQPYAQNISTQLIDVLNKAIQPSAKDRYPNAQAMLDALTIPTQIQSPSQPQPAQTIVSTVPANSQQPQTVYAPTGNQSQGQSNNSQNSLTAAVIGVGVGGVLIILGLVLGKNFNNNDSTRNTDRQSDKVATTNNTTTNNSIPNNTPIPSNNSTNNINSTPIPSNPTTNPSPNLSTNSAPSVTIQSASPVNNTSSISRDAAVDVVKQWLAYKQVLMAPPYSKQLGSDLLVGKAYRDNVDKSFEPCSSSDSDDCLSSVDWLKKYNAQYSFGVQRIDTVNRFESSGDTGTIFVTVTEYRTLHKTGGRTTSSGGTKQARYDLKYENGKVKIADYKVLN
jgi:serine/threonine protein kinase